MTEGAARSTVLKVTQVEPSHGFVAWQALVDGHAPKSSNDPAIALQPILATPEICKDAKQLEERLTAWSLKVAEYEQQFKVIGEAQRTFVVREMMPKGHQAEVPDGTEEVRRNYGVTGDHRQRNDGRRRTSTDGSGEERRRVTRTRVTTCRTTMCVRGKDAKLAKEQARKDRTEWECGIVEKDLMKGRVAEEMTEERKEVRRARKAANLIGTVTQTKDPMETKARERAKVERNLIFLRLRRANAYWSELSIQVDQQHRRRR